MTEIITTVEQLSALPVETVGRDALGHLVIVVPGLFNRYPKDVLWPTTGRRSSTAFARGALPITVTGRPGAAGQALIDAAEALNYGEAATLRSSTMEHPEARHDPLLVLSTQFIAWLRERGQALL